MTESFVLVALLVAAVVLVLIREKVRADRALAAQARAEAEREKAQARYRVMAEEASDIIMLFENERVVCASSALNRILGCSPEAIEEGGYLNLVHPDDLAEAKKLRGQPMPGETWTATYRAFHADGHIVWLEASTRGAYDEATGTLCEITVTRDITERKEQELKMRAAQERAEAANKAKSMFLATMSHELRTPLNAILGFSEILELQHAGADKDARQREYLKAIHDSGVHLLGLISDILDMSKLDTGKLELRMETIDLLTLISECELAIAPQAEKAKVRLLEKLDARASAIRADRKRLRQMVMNLLSNAVKFTPAGGEVRISTACVNDGIAITVADTGIGMEAEAIPKAFEPFSQIDSSLSRKYEGSGLGLPLTKLLAELHGATLQIESKLGAGTTITIVFPDEHVLAGRRVA